MASMSYLQKHPKTDVYRVRRSIPEAARFAFQGRAVFLKTLGTKNLVEAKRLAFPVLAELQSKIDRALADYSDVKAEVGRREVFARSGFPWPFLDRV